MNTNSKIIILFTIISIVGFYAYFSIDFTENETIVEEMVFESELENTIIIGTIGKDAVTHIENFQPIANYIATKLSDDGNQHKGKVEITKTIDSMVIKLQKQKIDLFIDSPITTTIVSEQTDAKPLLIRWKGGNENYSSVLFVKTNSGISSIDDFVDKTIVFENKESTSGYLLAKSYLIKNGFDFSPSIDSTNNINQIFAGGDVNVPLWVHQGKADIGVSSNLDFVEINKNYDGEFIIIAETESVPRHVVTHRSNLDSDLVEKIKQILMDMDKDSEGIELLKNFKNTVKFDEIQNKYKYESKMTEIVSFLK
jgi:phosphonate transport system substrate-binding protein